MEKYIKQPIDLRTHSERLVSFRLPSGIFRSRCADQMVVLVSVVGGRLGHVAGNRRLAMQTLLKSQFLK